MIGFYNYTVILTFLSLLSGTAGSFLCLSGVASPAVGMLFLMFSGVCDSFDGTVARTKKNRSRREQCFGVQIDSLADLMSFGMLPASVGVALLFSGLPQGEAALTPVRVLLLVVALAFVLAALIRLAFFNVLEEERDRTRTGERKVYVGLPTTSVALIFPGVLLLQHLVKVDLTWLYFAGLAAVAWLFVCKLEIPKPGTKGILALIGLGLVEFVVMLATCML